MPIPDTEALRELTRYPRSVVQAGDTTFCVVSQPQGKALAVSGRTAGFDGERTGDLLICPLSAANAEALREKLPWLRPVPLGLQRTAGCGDRLGLATPGHIRAVRRVGGYAPVLAQQSVRENERTGRSPAQVMNDAMWAVFQEGWHEPWGADADHLKTPGAADSFVAAGYTLYTLDPGDHVDNAATSAPLDALRASYAGLPWAELGETPTRLRERYLSQSFRIEQYSFGFDELTYLRAACKYARAVSHAASLYRHLSARLAGKPWEMEVSVDETHTPTTALEHIFIAAELRRLGVSWVSLAPRYIGRFEKGVDYIGDLAQFEADFAQHAAIARAMGPYKLSLHSGSDKFSIYPIVARHAGDLVHLKTAGTSHLEALRTIAVADPRLMCAIWQTAYERYDTDRASYHVSAELRNVPSPAAVADAELPALLDQFDARQVLHVTFGSVLAQWGPAIRNCLAQHEDAHYSAIEAHFVKHLKSLAA